MNDPRSSLRIDHRARTWNDLGKGRRLVENEPSLCLDEPLPLQVEPDDIVDDAERLAPRVAVVGRMAMDEDVGALPGRTRSTPLPPSKSGHAGVFGESGAVRIA